MITAYQTISDLESVECGENARYAQVEESEILKFFKGEISYEEYVRNNTPREGSDGDERKGEQLTLFDFI